VIRQFSEWLKHTPVSEGIQNTFWIIPTVQTVHILAIAIVMSSVLVLNLRLLGIAARTQTFAEVAERYLPWVWSALAVLLVTGCILIVAEPGRELGSEVFWLKMSLLFGVIIVTAAVQCAQTGQAEFWERRRLLSVITAIVSLTLWIGILSAGRWIAYVEHD
jgi:hypothetical protein